MSSNSNYGWGSEGYTTTSAGTNSQGNHYCHREGSGSSNGYHYSNGDGGYYYQNPNGSTYYKSGSGSSKYTPPSGGGKGSSKK